MHKAWFSSKLRFAVMKEPHGLEMFMDSVRVFRAVNYEEAFKRALEEGRGDEKTYFNSEGHRVAWKLAEVVSLDRIGDELMDGQEIYSEPIFAMADPAMAFEHEFYPEASTPTQTR